MGKWEVREYPLYLSGLDDEVVTPRPARRPEGAPCSGALAQPSSLLEIVQVVLLGGELREGPPEALDLSLDQQHQAAEVGHQLLVSALPRGRVLWGELVPPGVELLQALLPHLVLPGALRRARLHLRQMVAHRGYDVLTLPGCAA